MMAVQRHQPPKCPGRRVQRVGHQFGRDYSAGVSVSSMSAGRVPGGLHMEIGVNNRRNLRGAKTRKYPVASQNVLLKIGRRFNARGNRNECIPTGGKDDGGKRIRVVVAKMNVKMARVRQ